MRARAIELAIAALAGWVSAFLFLEWSLRRPPVRVAFSRDDDEPDFA